MKYYGDLPIRAKKDTPEFEQVMESFYDAYFSYYPGLAGYVYQGDVFSPESGEEIKEEIFRRIDEIEMDNKGYFWFRLQGESEWRSADDSNDFPQPFAEHV